MNAVAFNVISWLSIPTSTDMGIPHGTNQATSYQTLPNERYSCTRIPFPPFVPSFIHVQHLASTLFTILPTTTQSITIAIPTFNYLQSLPPFDAF